MSIDGNASLAGDGASTTADDAVSNIANLLLADDDRTEEDAGPAEAQASDEEPSPDEAAASDEETSSEPEVASTEDEPPSEPDDDAIPLDKLHGNTKIRLRDGSEWTAAQLKARIGELQEIERAKADFAAREQQVTKQIEAERAQIAQSAQFFQQAMPVLLAKMQADIPPPPPRELLETDPIEYIRLKEVRDYKIGEFQQVQHQAAHYQRQQQAAIEAKANEAKQAQTHQYREYVQRELDTLVKEMPELADPVKANAFHGKVVKGAEVIGFSADDLQTVADRRVLRGLAMIAEYQALRSQKPAAQQKVASAPPVKPPGKRVSDAEQVNKAYVEDRDRVRKTGRAEDAAAFLAKHFLR